MEYLVGYDPASLAPDIDAWRAHFREMHIDLGTGDAAYAVRLARQRPDLGVLGVDTCLDHVRGSRRCRPLNLALLWCDAAAVPVALDGSAGRVTVNFPYGGLLIGLLDRNDCLLTRLGALLAPAGVVEVRINASALAGSGHTPATAERALMDVCRRLGCDAVRARTLAPVELRRFPSSWAKRIGFGREAAAIEVIGARRPDGSFSAALA